MPKKTHHVELSDEEQERLKSILRKGRASALRQRHTRILLLADTHGPDGGRSDAQISKAAAVSIPTIERVRRLFVEQGLERALEAKEPARVYRRKLDGCGEAQLLAISCGAAPAGHARWTLRLLARRLIELEVVEAISHEAVRQMLKKMKSSPGRKSSG